MPTLDVYNTSAKKTSTVSGKPKLFAAKINKPLMSQAVRVYLANQRQAPAKTKSRGEIKISKSKIWRQKGTGRARHHSRNAPIFVGGAKAHGPTGEQNFKLKLSQPMKQKALFSALTSQFQAKNILVIDGLDKLEPKTKRFNQLFTKITKTKTPKKLLLLLDKAQPSISRATGNLPYLTASLAANLNTYQTLNADQIIFTKDGLKALETHYGK